MLLCLFSLLSLVRAHCTPFTQAIFATRASDLVGVTVSCSSKCGPDSCFETESECRQLIHQCTLAGSPIDCIAAYALWGGKSSCSIECTNSDGPVDCPGQAAEATTDTTTATVWTSFAVSSGFVGLAGVALAFVRVRKTKQLTAPVTLGDSDDESMNPYRSSPHFLDSALHSSHWDTDTSSTQQEDEIFLNLESFHDVAL
ncbi:MAG: hypothetical protein KVP17_002726 [Porospora cf. gigantea B]|uniref:uncharacterized protein n=1 Tax=Porospora cf. gigantea B TaxID=2853592 RepID=UPI003571EFC9|nr:MAG: hypothetical protein KVP17_002726 [Porospora cf. gigantea B]